MALERVPGVESADVSYASERAVVVFDPAVTSPAVFIAELERLTGFSAAVDDRFGDPAGALRAQPGDASADEPRN